MSLSINTNIASLNAQRSLQNSQMDLTTALQRLSTGLRINSAKDDAAGLAISARLTSQINGLNQASRNANDGISLSQTAESALGEDQNILQRIRELAVQSANDTNSGSDRSAMQLEVSQLMSELNRVATSTQFNGKNLLNGSFANARIQVGAGVNDSIGVTLVNVSGNAIGNNGLTSNTGTGSIAAAKAVSAAYSGNNVTAQTLTISGNLGSSNVTLAANDSASTIATAVNAVTSSTGVSARATTTATLSALSGAGLVSFTLGNGSASSNITAAISSTADLTALANAINNASANTGTTAVVTAGTIVLTNSVGDDIRVSDFASDASNNQTISFRGDSASAAVTLTEADTDSSAVSGKITFTSAYSYTVATSGSSEVIGATNASSLSAASTIDISTQAGAITALDIVDGALTSISDSRSKLGALQSRFRSAISNVQSIAENLTAARGRIQDADFGQETAKLTRAQILQQAGMTVLQQANAIPQGVLALLK